MARTTATISFQALEVKGVGLPRFSGQVLGAHGFDFRGLAWVSTQYPPLADATPLPRCSHP